MAIHQYRAGIVVGDRQGLVGQQRRHTELGIAGKGRECRFKLRAVAIFLPDKAQQLITNLVAHGVGNDYADSFVLTQVRANPVLEKGLLLNDRIALPARRGIHVNLEAIAQLEQVVVGIQVLHLLTKFPHQRCLAGHAHMVGKLAIELIQLEPGTAVSLNAVGEAFHGETSLSEHLDKAGRQLNGFIQVSELPVPVALAPLPHPQRHITTSDRAAYHRPHQVTDNLLVD